MKQTVVVIGNGMVGQRFCALLRESRGSDRFRITVLGEEPRPAYDRVHLTEYFSGKSAADLEIAPRAWYRDQGIDLRVGTPALAVDREWRVVTAAGGLKIKYDHLVFATGSAPFVPPLPGIDRTGIFVYRTIEDLDAIRDAAASCRSAAVIGGGLLGLEAAKALYDLGLGAHVVEAAPWLMPRQLDRDGAELLAAKIRSLGVQVHTNKRTREITQGADGRSLRFCFEGDDSLDVDLIVVSAGIRPRHELAADCGLELGPRGGIAVDATMRTSDPAIFAIGECASHDGTVYGLVAPGFEMADVAAAQIAGFDKSFRAGDMSTKLKLLGVEVASIGESTAPQTVEHTHVAVRDDVAGVYKKLIVRRDTRTLIGAVLVGDTGDYANLLRLFRRAEPLPDRPLSLIVDGTAVRSGEVAELTGDCLLCTCNNVTVDDVTRAVAAGAVTMPAIQACTKAATGCGGCGPQIKQVLERELQRAGVEVRKQICEHFALRRQELFDLVRVRGYRTYDEVLANCGRGGGCEVCKPVVASILASIHAEPASARPVIQDTNDRFLANIQRGGTYSVVPRIPGGEITAEKLIVLGEVARRYGLYVKITGGQRIDMFGARLDQLPAIWEELVAAGFESGHAYAKAMRTVKSCVGSTWCRYGVLDSVGFAIRVEERYKGLRAPHKLKSAVSGCIRECAEARSKDFGIIATSEGWNLYVCGNGGSKPRHAVLLAAGIDDETCLRYIDRFLMFYIRTADPLTRTARWLEELDGGIDYLRAVVIDDVLGICEQLDAEMQAAVDGYRCEWAEVVNDPEKRRRFRAFVNAAESDPSIAFARERGQIRPSSGGGALALPVVRLAPRESTPEQFAEAPHV